MTETTINSTCQAEIQDEFSQRRSPSILFGPSGVVPRLRRLSVLAVSAARYLRSSGVVYTFKKSVGYVVRGVHEKLIITRREEWKTPAIDGAVLTLQSGEWVEVKPLDEIMQTLDSQGKTHGLYFTNEMKLHCGRRYRVFKRVESIFNEFTKEQRKVQNTVLLETVFCQGEGLGCNRSCFHMWREAWLRRSAAPPVSLVDQPKVPLFTILNNGERKAS